MEFVGAVLISLLLSATAIVLSELLRPKPKFENARPAALGDFQFPTAVEGRPIPLVWGTVKISGPNVVWYGDLRQAAITKGVRTGLWSTKRITTGFRYNVGIQMGLCRGPVDALRKVWIGEVKVFDGSTTTSVSINKPDLFGGDDFGSGGVVGTLRVHPGTETQAVNTYLSGRLANLPAYRGTCHLVWEGGYIGNSTTIKPWSFEVQRLPNGLGVTGGKHVVNSLDSNPMCVLWEALTDTDWGMGLSTTLVDATNLRSIADVLHGEGNGFSMILDREIEGPQLIRELERQIEGVVFIDPADGKIRVKLARADYNIDTVPQLTSTNLLELMSFGRGTWDDTLNQVRVRYSDRAKDYRETFTQGHDLANQRIQAGQILSSTVSYPGVKTRALANQLAGRQLRYHSIPLVKATVAVDRSFWDVKPGEVIAWTHANLGFVKLAMRVASVRLGTATNGRIELTLVQDIYSFQQPFFGEGFDTLWTSPTTNVDPFPTAQQRAIEAPWALVRRDPSTPEVGDRLYAAGRRQTGGELSFKIWERHSAGSPSGAFAEAGEVLGFALIGQLKDALSAGTANPATTVGLNGTPDDLATLQAAFEAGAAAADIGQNLLNLLLVDDEFLAVTTVVNQGTHLDLGTVYRGMLDTAPAAHAQNANVFLVFVGAGLSDSVLPATNNVDVKLRPRSLTDEVTEGDATTIALTMQNRVRRPYPPVKLLLNTSSYPTSVDFDTMRSGGTTLDDRGIDSAYTRRDWRTLDEVDGIVRDAGTISSTFPTANNTKYKAKLIKDPAGTPVTLFETAFNSGAASIFLSRTRILRYNAGLKPANLRVEITARHDFEGATYDALQLLRWDFATAASTLDNDTNLGVLNENVISNTYTAPTTGTYNFALGTALSSGIVEARINGGAFGTVISAGNTTGTLAGVVANDTIEVRHTQGGSDTAETFLEIDAPSSSVDAYAVIVI